jgi:hypothetical protein
MGKSDKTGILDWQKVIHLGHYWREVEFMCSISIPGLFALVGRKEVDINSREHHITTAETRLSFT